MSGVAQAMLRRSRITDVQVPGVCFSRNGRPEESNGVQRDVLALLILG